MQIAYVVKKVLMPNGEYFYSLDESLTDISQVLNGDSQRHQIDKGEIQEKETIGNKDFKSGDGTVPYESLAYPRLWQNADVELIEVRSSFAFD